MDLFESLSIGPSGAPAFNPDALLAVRVCPLGVDKVLGQERLLAKGSPLRQLLEVPAPGAPKVSSVILWGPPGTGKTTLAYLVARTSGRRFEELSAVSSGVKDIHDVVSVARRSTAAKGEDTTLFTDGVHRFSKSQQDALLPAAENQWVTLIAATTENPSFSVISPLLSHSLLLTLESLDEEAISQLIDRALVGERGLKGLLRIDKDARNALIRVAGSDARKSLILLEASVGAAVQDQCETVSLVRIESAADSALVRWDKDQRYDVASALIKSMRGSDVGATVHYLAQTLEAGEDPRFIARRIMICASEDVEMAAPEALATTVAAAQAVAMISMPEARIILIEAVIAVASAPKSDAAYLAVDRAIAGLRRSKGVAAPTHLHDSHYSGAKRIGHGQDYVCAHDAPHHIAVQQYLPEDLRGTRYYEPTQIGHEAPITKCLAVLRELLTMR